MISGPGVRLIPRDTLARIWQLSPRCQAVWPSRAIPHRRAPRRCRDDGGVGERPEYHACYYSAYVLDPTGNRLEAVCHRDPSTDARPKSLSPPCGDHMIAEADQLTPGTAFDVRAVPTSHFPGRPGQWARTGPSTPQKHARHSARDAWCGLPRGVRSSCPIRTATPPRQWMRPALASATGRPR